MKKLLLLTLTALSMSSLTSLAFTPQEFVDKGKAWVRANANSLFDQTRISANVPCFSEANKTLIADVVNNKNVLVVKGSVFIDQDKLPGSENVYFFLEINGNKASFPFNVYNTQCIQIDTDIYSKDKKQYPLCVDTWCVLLGTDDQGYTYFLMPPVNKSRATWTTQLTPTVGTTADGEYFIKLDNCFIYKVFADKNEYLWNGALYTGNHWNLAGGLCPGEIYIQTYSNTNAEVTDTEYTFSSNGRTKSNPKDRSYTANVTYDAKKNLFHFFNWNNTGNPFFVDWDNYGRYTYEELTYDAKWFPEEMDLQLLGCEYLGGFSSSSSSSIYSAWMGTNYTGEDIYSVTGTPKGYITHHEDNLNNWLDASHNSTKFVINSIDFVDYMTVFTDIDWPFGYGYRSYNKSIENTKYTFTTPIEIDYSHSLSINENIQYGRGEVFDDGKIYLYINCQLENHKNTYFVDHYELYIVPEVKNPSYKGDDFGHEDNGHQYGTRIDLPKYRTNFDPSAPNTVTYRTLADTDEEITDPNVFNLLIPEDDLIVPDGDGRYSLYVKTIYTEESELDPSFHSLTTIGQVTTGVEDIVASVGDDSDAPAVYYNLNGVVMDGDNLAPGIYIRRQGNTSTKVVIR